MDDFEIGIITKAQGIRGEVRVMPTTDDPSRFELLEGDFVRVGENSLKLTAARLQKNIVILKLEGVDDRNAAERLAGTRIFVPKEKALPLDDGEFYIRDLVGLRAQTEDGEALGVLSRVLHTGANDVYVIEETEDMKKAGDESTSETLAEKSSEKPYAFMVPAIKEVVREVNLEQGVVVLRLMEGMRELRI